MITNWAGTARDLARGMTFAEMTTGGVVNGRSLDPVSFLLTQLAVRFAPLGEEARLAAMQELMNFQRRPNESIDALIARFLGLRFRARQVGGGGLTMS